MTCADIEILVCDYMDGTLPAEEKSALQEHVSNCVACSELARDAAAAVGFMERVASEEPPAELVTRILYDLSASGPVADIKKSWLRRVASKWLEPILQPRFAMGMAMTVLSFAMMGRFAGIEVRQLRPADLDPVKVWAAVDDRAHRSWERALKYYESLRLVYEIQSRLKEWTDQDEEDKKARAVAQPDRPTDKTASPIEQGRKK